MKTQFNKKSKRSIKQCFWHGTCILPLLLGLTDKVLWRSFKFLSSLSASWWEGHHLCDCLLDSCAAFIEFLFVLIRAELLSQDACAVLLLCFPEHWTKWHLWPVSPYGCDLEKPDEPATRTPFVVSLACYSQHFLSSVYAYEGLRCAEQDRKCGIAACKLFHSFNLSFLITRSVVTQDPCSVCLSQMYDVIQLSCSSFHLNIWTRNCLCLLKMRYSYSAKPRKLDSHLIKYLHVNIKMTKNLKSSCV